MSIRRLITAAVIIAGGFLVFANSSVINADDADSTQVRAITFSRDVAPILQKNCQTCHHPGDIGPMSLMNFRDSRPWAKSIKKAVTDRTMPPWSAHPDVGEFVNDVSLSDEDINTVVAWVDQGAREGDKSDLPAALEFNEAGWKQGEPDIMFQYPEPYNVGAEVEDEYRCFVMPIGTANDIWLKSTEYKPGDRAVVHHFIAFIDRTDTSKKLDDATPEPGFECDMASGNITQLKLVGAWAPGNNPERTAEGTALKIPGNSYLVLQIHYHNTTGEDRMDQSMIGMYAASEVIHQEPQIELCSAWVLNIAANDPNSYHTARWHARKDMTIGSIAPHMHLRGKSMKVYIQKPGEEEKLALWVPNFDFNWQITYRLKEPLQLPKGTWVRMESIHDNSAGNPNNPAPEVEIHWGEESNNEMAIAWLGLLIDDQDLNMTPVYPIEFNESKAISNPVVALVTD